MNGPQLKAWRQSEDLSLREVSEILNGDPTVSTLSRWENSTEEIPSLVSERLLNSTLITLPLGELHQLLDYCRATQQPFHTVLARALREHLSRTQSATIPAHATTTEAAPAIHEPAPPTDSQATQAGQAWIEAKNLQSEIPPGYAIGKLTVTPDEAALINAAAEKERLQKQPPTPHSRHPRQNHPIPRPQSLPRHQQSKSSTFIHPPQITTQPTYTIKL